MSRLFLIPLLLVLSLIFLGGCASTSTTTIGVTTNEAPPLHELVR